ncbi:MAG: hypothetical protein D6794_03995 [Deltaproteobacteria bacterium]|nr:MAG: hypothetical protein D6794_03995 [Deltaproteobacteria bacterium]
MLEGFPSAIARIDAAGRMVWSNRRSGGVLGQSPTDVGHSGDRPLHDCYGLGERCPVCCALSSGRPCEEQVGDERDRLWHIKAIPLPDNSGVIRITTDVTEEHRLRLEHEQASRLAAVGELAAGIAHEINNPNGMIQMNLGLIADVWNDLQPLLDDAQSRQPDLSLAGLSAERLRMELPQVLEDMLHASFRIKGIVEDLKSFVRRQDEDRMEDIDLNQVYLTAARLLRNQIKKCQADYREHLMHGLPPVHGQFRHLEQVVINLVMNACQALEKPGASLAVSTWYDTEQKEVVLAVEDGGKGIAPQDLPRVTDPFFTTRRTQGGTGLGLSVSQRIVREHGGKLLFQSELGRGTRVELRLPAVETAEEERSDTADACVLTG